MKCLILTAIVGAGMTFLLPTASAADDKLAPELQFRDFDATVNVIVRFKEARTVGGIHRLVSRGARHKRQLELVHSSVFTARIGDLAVLAADPDVEYIAPDREVHAIAFTGGPDYGWMTVTGITNPLESCRTTVAISASRSSTAASIQSMI